MRAVGWVGLLVLCGLPTAALSHDWYELACCRQHEHCGPVSDGTVTENKDGVHVKDHGILSYSDPRLRWSRDNQDHICADKGKLLCVYRRPKGM